MTGPPSVEDPISAIFDLSDQAAGMAPVVRRLYKYTASILAFWFVIMIILILVGLGNGGWLSLLPLGGLAAGVIAFGLLRQTDRFFRDFAQRHRWIHLVREADPRAKVPDGRTPIERLGRYLAASNPRVEARLKSDPAALQYRVGIRAGDREIPLDLLITEPGSWLWRHAGSGEPGFAIVGRLGPESPTLDDVRRLEADGLAAGRSLPGRLVRLILLRTGNAPIPQDVYEYAVGHPILSPRGGKVRVTLEIISEGPNGTYDFIPHVLGIP